MKQHDKRVVPQFFNTAINKKKILPFGWHWLYFNEIFTFDKMGPDGHQKRGSFLPPFKGCKRMFAGSEIKFKKKITVFLI